MDIQCLLEQEIYTDRSGISEFRIVEDGTGKRFLARGFLHEVKTGARLILKGVSGPDGGRLYLLRLCPYRDQHGGRGGRSPLLCGWDI